jgi:uncharacterized protein YndB with AHSA1/START domain
MLDKTAGTGDRELVLTRIMDAAPDKLFRCWTDPKLMVQWFTPPPWKTTHVETDLRAGGSSYVLMEGPNGEKIPNRGIYLEVVPNQKIVFTDAFTSAWEPSAKPFMVATVTFEDIGGGKTRYTATARHWTVEDREAHEKMGFHEGWGVAADQLEALAKKI